MKLNYWKSLQRHIITSRGAVVVLVWTALTHFFTLLTSGPIIGSAYLPNELIVPVTVAFLLANSVGYLLYPVSPVIAYSWSRFGTIVVGFTLQAVGTVITTVTVTVLHFVEESCDLWYIWAFFVFSTVLITLGLVLQEPNILQMGAILMPEASSDQLSAYVQWFYLCLYIGNGLTALLLYILSLFIDYTTSSQYISLFLCYTQLVFCAVVVILAVVYRKTLSLEFFSKRNPLKQIYNVFSYAAWNKYPRQRSAVTYGEMPSRFDLVKSRYGGPYSTEYVEDVKTFCRICLLFLSLSVLGFFDGYVTAFRITAVASPEQSNEVSFEFLTRNSEIIRAISILICVSMYQLVIKPLFHRYIPTILKRIFIGLVLLVAAICFLQILEVLLAHSVETTLNTDACSFYSNYSLQLVSNDTSVPFPFQLLVVPLISQGIAYQLVVIAMFEFTLAQSPHNMQGLLIGIYYSSQFIYAAASFLQIVECFVWKYAVQVCVYVIFICLYVAVARFYRKRQREEPSQHNQQQVVEHVYELYLNQEMEESTLLESQYFIIED